MKTTKDSVTNQGVFSFNETNIKEVEGLSYLLDRFSKRIKISYAGFSTVKTYRRTIRDISLFHGCLADGLEVDEILDYLHHLKEKGLSWAKIKLDVAALKYFLREIAHDEARAAAIPYPKEEKTLPNILSREELLRLFNAAPNPKHRVILRLLYSSGLRRAELINLRIEDLETDDGKRRIRINKSKGSKDRYTVLSEKVLNELRDYYNASRPKVYLFNGQRKGEAMSNGLLRHILQQVKKRSGITKPVSLHTLRHCFASHALEDGMSLRTLQEVLGH